MVTKSKTTQSSKTILSSIFDVYGKESVLEGIRTEFKTHDVAWSFMKQYKKAYPLYNFAIVSDLPKSENQQSSDTSRFKLFYSSLDKNQNGIFNFIRFI